MKIITILLLRRAFLKREHKIAQCNVNSWLSRLEYHLSPSERKFAYIRPSVYPRHFDLCGSEWKNFTKDLEGKTLSPSRMSLGKLSLYLDNCSRHASVYYFIHRTLSGRFRDVYRYVYVQKDALSAAAAAVTCITTGCRIQRVPESSRKSRSILFSANNKLSRMRYAPATRGKVEKSVRD